jgi:diacylglycerol kinase (ATP)
MRVLLITNHKAGEADRSDEIRGLIKSSSHKLYEADDREVGEIAAAEYDLVAVAGGDGTVTKVAKQLVGKPLPLTILPIGTANNLAHSLGFTDEPAALVPRWSEARLTPLDAAVIQHHKGRDFYFESAGVGLFTEAMCLAKSHDDSEEKWTADERFDRDFRLMRRMASSFSAWPCRIEMDGKASDENVLLCEIMNTRQIGSRLVLAPEASLGDGWLDLVLVTEADRGLLKEFLEREPSDDHLPHLPVRRGKRFKISSMAERIHVGDEIEKLPTATESWELEVSVQPGAVQVLVP